MSAGAGRPNLRVCMAIQTFRPTVGGAELQLERILPHLAARDVEVTVLTRRVAGQPSHERIGGGVVRRVGIPGRSVAASVAYVAMSLAHLLRHRATTDVVHAHGAKSPGTIAIGATLLGMPAVVLVIGVGSTGDFERVAAKPGGRLRIRWLTRRTRFIALSAEARAEIIAHGAGADRVVTIPNGVDTRTYRPADRDRKQAARRQLGLGDGVIGLFVGRLHPVKEVETLIRALAAVPGLDLVLVGDGPQRAVLERLASSGGVADRVSFVGFSDAVPDYLAASDVFLLPSRREGMSNALLEAMATGLACLASPASGTAELLGSSRGLVAPAGDVPAWGQAMSRLAGDPDLRAELGRRASELVHRDYSLEAAADRLVAAYVAAVAEE